MIYLFFNTGGIDVVVMHQQINANSKVSFPLLEIIQIS